MRTNKPDRYSVDAFTHGWRRGMLSIAEGLVTAADKARVKTGHTRAFYDGFVAAIDHFHGCVTNGTELGFVLGLHDAYAGFYGQQGFKPADPGPPECSICRGRHGSEIIHPCE